MIDFTKVEQDVKAGLPEVAKNPESAWRKVEAILLQSYRRQFLSGGDGKWMPSKHGVNNLMVNSGKLLNSAMTSSDGQSAQLNWGSGLPYARRLQTGVGLINVTPGMKKLFWRRWYDSGKSDDFWRKMAITKKATFSVPARSIGLSREDVDLIATALGTRDFQLRTNWGASILPY